MIIDNIKTLNETLDKSTLVKDFALNFIMNDVTVIKDDISLDTDLQDNYTCEVQIKCKELLNFNRILRALKKEFASICEIYTQVCTNVNSTNYYITIVIDNK